MGNCLSDPTVELLRACDSSNYTEVQRLISIGANVNARDADGMTALAKATRQNAAAIVSLLLSTGAGDRIADHSGALPIHHACETGALDCIEMLIGNGSTVNAETLDGTCPLHFAANFGRVEIVRSLLDNGAFLEQQDRDDDTALSIAALQGHAAVVQLLLRRGAKCEWRNSTRPTALHRAIVALQLSPVKVIVDTIPRVIVQQDFDGFTPLHVAAQAGATAICVFLIEIGSSVQAEDIRGRTPLFHAVTSCNKACVDLLLIKGSDWAHKDHEGVTPLQYLASVDQQASTRYVTKVQTLEDVVEVLPSLPSAAQPMVIDLVKRLETHKISLALVQRQHQSELLLKQSQLEQGHEQHQLSMQELINENERLHGQIDDLQATVRRLRATSTGQTISQLAAELAQARAKLTSHGLSVT